MLSLRTLAVAFVMLAPGTAWAQSAGETEYMNHCASCHGADAKGQGPLAELMTIAMPDLTQVSARNDGVFPMLDVIQIIDGRTGVRGHGYPMPVWGSRFKDAMGEDAGTYAAEVYVRGRILVLADYLETLQE